MPAEAYASVAASTRRSSGPLSQCSPKGVQPMPTIATRSLIPLLAIAFSLLPKNAPAFFGSLLAARSGLPEIVVHALCSVQPAEGHLEVVADRDLLRIHVRQL